MRWIKLKIITELSSINEIRNWLDFYGVNYKKSERKAQLVRKMNEIKEKLIEDPNVPGGFELLTPDDAQKLQEFNQLISLLKEAKLYCSNYLANALLENSIIETQNELVLINNTEPVKEYNSDTNQEPESSEIVLDGSIIPLIGQETLLDSEKKSDSEIKEIKEIEEIEKDNSLDKKMDQSVEENEDSEAVEDEELEDFNGNEVKNNFKGTLAGIFMVGIPAIGLLYWLVSSGIL